MKIVQLNVRFSEGGAARVARSLYHRSLESGYDANFIYGYGPSGRDDTAASSDPRIARSVTRTEAALNFAVHSLIGIDVLGPRQSPSLDAILSDADIVHFHAIHSHMGVLSRFLDHVSPEAKVVWTHHDFWAITGRCGFPGECTRWQTGCGACPDLGAYPSSKMDYTSLVHRRRRRFLRETARKITHVSPSEHMAKCLVSAGFDSVRVILNSVDEEFARAADQESRVKVEFDILIAANDLSYKGKTNHTFVKELVDLGLNVATIGHNSPFEGENVTNFGPTDDREKIVQIMRQSQYLLFTSVVDNFSLLLLESLYAGLPVLYTPSDCATEILVPFNQTEVKSPSDVLAKLQPATHIQNLVEERKALSEMARAKFGPSIMADKYISMYQALRS